MATKAVQGNVFGGHDQVTVRRNGTCRVRSSHVAGPKQFNLLTGEAEFSETKRNPFTEERERQDEARGLVAR